MLYLLDTNILSDLPRNPKGRVAERMSEAGEVNVCTSVIVAAELRFGALKKGSARLTERIEDILRVIKIMPFETPADSTYADLRAMLERSGQPIGNNDMLIAAHALTLGCCMVTDNVKEFGKIKNLRCENWLR